MDIIQVDPAFTSCQGPKAVEVFRLAAIASGLGLEIKCPGIKISRHGSALKAAKLVTGLKTNDRAKQLERVKVMLEQARSEVLIVETNTTQEG